jgi:hypothetical protein
VALGADASGGQQDDVLDTGRSDERHDVVHVAADHEVDGGQQEDRVGSVEGRLESLGFGEVGGESSDAVRCLGDPAGYRRDVLARGGRRPHQRADTCDHLSSPGHGRVRAVGMGWSRDRVQAVRT